MSHVTKALKWNGYPRSATGKQRNGVVYRIFCADSDMTFDGQTGHTLKIHRKKKHLRALSNADPQTSALAEHALTYHNDIAWNEPEVLDSNIRTKNVP